MDTQNPLKLPWKYVHAEGLSNYGDIKDCEGDTVCSIFAVFPDREEQVKHILERCNVPLQQEIIEDKPSLESEPQF